MPKTPEQETREARADEDRGRRAAELLNNPLYLEAITVMRAAMYTEFEDTKLSDEDKRHELWQRMQLMKRFQGRFESIVKQGEKAKKTLSLLEKAKDAIKRI